MLYFSLVFLNLAYAYISWNGPILFDLFILLAFLVAMLSPLEVDAYLVMWRVLLLAFRYVLGNFHKDFGKNPDLYH